VNYRFIRKLFYTNIYKCLSNYSNYGVLDYHANDDTTVNNRDCRLSQQS